MGLEGALRFRMLSRRAVFLDFFSMDGDFGAGAGEGAGFAAGFADLADLAGAAGFAAGFGAGFDAGFGAALELAFTFPLLAGFLFLVAMGFWGG
jgi:hypothetical protein